MASFNINFPGDSNEFAVNANKTISSKGGIFQGDKEKGSFSIQTAVGAVKGTYQVIGLDSTGKTKVAVTITKKPMIVPMSAIEKTIQDFF